MGSEDSATLNAENSMNLDQTDIVSDAEWRDRQAINESDSPINFEHSKNTDDVSDPSGKTLADHLLWQLGLETLNTKEMIIGQVIIDLIDENGYLKNSIEDILETLSPDIQSHAEEIEIIISHIQTFDPAGVAARTLSECILLQLNEFKTSTSELKLAKAIAHKLDSIPTPAELNKTLKRNLQITDKNLEIAWLLIQGCNRQPGASINTLEPHYVIPDVYVKKSAGQWIVELNTSATPRLKINQKYARSLDNRSEFAEVKKMFEEAKWLIRGLEQREETIKKVTQVIVQKQKEFLGHGEEYMRPMILRDVADEVGIHESTVSRITNNKYMHTPRGIFKLRFFFSSHINSNEGLQSSTSVKAKIRVLISMEDPTKPLSDDKIAAVLLESGINVARRTVAKYREAINIPSSSKRKHV
jgi:RNA polymerase sigma-54 factor